MHAFEIQIRQQRGQDRVVRHAGSNLREALTLGEAFCQPGESVVSIRQLFELILPPGGPTSRDILEDLDQTEAAQLRRLLRQVQSAMVDRRYIDAQTLVEEMIRGGEKDAHQEQEVPAGEWPEEPHPSFGEDD